jgi:hypothetical protein
MESELQTKCNKFLKDHDYSYFHDEKGRGNGKRHRSGLPDIVVWNSPICFFELKTKTGKQTKKQQEFERMCEKQGHLYYVVRDFDFFKSLIIRIYGINRETV